VKFAYRFLIRLYQTQLSPRKGFRCAYSLEHGGPGCSGAVLEILETKGLILGMPSIRNRFQQCSVAAEEREKRRRREDRTACGCDGLDAALEAARACGGSRGCFDGADCMPDANCLSIGAFIRR